MAPRELESIENQAAGLHAPLISFPTLGLGGLAFLPLHVGTSRRGGTRVTGWPDRRLPPFVIRVRRDGCWRLSVWHLTMGAISGASVGKSSATQAFSRVGVRDAQRRYGRSQSYFRRATDRCPKARHAHAALLSLVEVAHISRAEKGAADTVVSEL